MDNILQIIKRIKYYILVNDDRGELLNIVTRFNRRYLLAVSRNIEEYINGQKSMVRLLLSKIISGIIFIVFIRFLACATVRKVIFNHFSFMD